MIDQGGGRIEALLDEGSFVELDRFGAGSGVVGGFGTITGRDVAVYATDAPDDAAGPRIAKVQELALRSRIPIVGLHGSPGAGPPADVIARLVRSSGVVPQVAILSGPCTFAHDLIDFVFVTDGSVENDIECRRAVRELLSYLPSHSGEAPPFAASADPADRTDPELQSLVSERVDLREVAARLMDAGQVLDVGHPLSAGLLAFGRLAGHAAGVVGLREAMDAGAVVAAARFVRFCDAFDVPLITVVDSPALAAEPVAVAKLLYAYAEATVPQLAVIVHRTPPPRLLGADLTVAWPAAEIAGAADPYAAAERGDVDTVIEPRETRRALARGLDLCRRKTVDRSPRKHGNIPL